MQIFAPHAKDFYKSGHIHQYPIGTNFVSANFTPRSGNHTNVPNNGVVFVGLQLFMKDYLIDDWKETFFDKPKKKVCKKYYRRIKNGIGRNLSIKHIEDLHDLGFLPIVIKALPEGSVAPYGVPFFTIYNTLPNFYWLPNMLESVLSAENWGPCTSATTSNEYRKLFTKWAIDTGGDLDFVPYQGHDFSFRGLFGRYATALSGLGHLASGMVGTDSIPAIDIAEDFYHADSDTELIGCSVDATEHSVMAAGEKNDEIQTFLRLITDLYPDGNISIVSDTWDFWQVVTSFLPQLKDVILGRDGKVVIRPDCYDDETLVLTDVGWKFFKDLTTIDKVAQILDDGTYEFVIPTKIINEKYQGEMYHFHDSFGKVDMLVTPNHRMIYQRNGEWEEALAENLYKGENTTIVGGYKNNIIRSAKVKDSNDTLKALTDFERLLIAFQADGSYCTNMNSSIRFHFSKERKILRMRDLLNKLGFSYKEYEISSGGIEFNIKVPANLMSKSFGWVDTLSISSQWCIDFIEELSYWDAHRRSDDRFKFDSTDKNVVDVVELITINAGYGVLGSEYVDDRNDKFNNVYTLHIMKNNNISHQAIKCNKVEYNGSVHCVTVTTGKLLVKRNKSIMVCGNSGDPVRIICGYEETEIVRKDDKVYVKKIIDHFVSEGKELMECEVKGLIECLWDTFGGTETHKGYKVLDQHIGAIYGDSITYGRACAILERLADKGFASTNVVLGIGSYTFQLVTRDTHGMAMKATYIEVNEVGREIFKDPKTDDGTKKSAKGLLRVDWDCGKLILIDQCTPEQEKGGELKEVFRDSKITKEWTLEEIRARVKSFD